MDLAKIDPPWPRASGDAPSSARWRLRLLGGFALDDGAGAGVERLPSRAITLLLARLALEPARAHGREELIELLWPGVAPDVGRNRLRQALSALRSVLEPRAAPASQVLLADRRTVSLVPGALACDVDALRLAVARGDAHGAARICRGELLPGFFDEWVIESRRALANLAEALALPALAPAAPGPAPAAAPAPAPAAVPGPAPGEAGGARGSGRARPAPLEPVPPRLPSYLTRRFGFDEAAASLAAAVAAHRLVVLRGPGGAGKTRLAVEVARALAAGAASGAPPKAGAGFDLVAFVALAACTTPEAMIDAVLLALRHDGDAAPPDGATHAGQRLARLERALGGRDALLVLDNFEQLVPAACDDLARWTANLPRLHLLVTSRHALGLDGEVEFALASLALPAPGLDLCEAARNPAVALFAARARAARADFHLSERNYALVAAIVRQLHGLPLAIELAAARVRSLSLADLRAMLESSAQQAPGSALALLARAGPRGADDLRHASMLRVVEWSWSHLDAAGRALLAALSVFDGGASLDAAAAAAGASRVAVAELLDELIASSVVYTSEGHAGSTRYHPFEPVREYALMTLGAADAARLRAAHLAWLCGWAAALGTAPSLEAFRDELPNLRAALAEAERRGDAAAAFGIVRDASYALDDVSLPASALPPLHRLLDAGQPADAALLARVHAILASQSFEAGERGHAERHALRAVQIVDREGPDAARVLRRAARVLLRIRGAGADVEPLLDAALHAARRHRQPDAEARALSLLAVLVAQRGQDMARSLALKREALALWREHGPPARVTEGLVNVAIGLDSRDAVQERLDLLAQARKSAAAHGQTRLLTFVLSVTGYTLADLRDWGASARCYALCLQAAWEGGFWREWFYGLWNLPRTLAHQRRPQSAALLMGFADAFYAERFGALAPADQREARRTRRLVRQQLGAAREAALWREGRALDMAAAMRLALHETAPPPGAPARLTIP
ncbi:MAG TPA: NACHT domain-containing protein [Burkholderiaceae bacterium]|nr:NACHT domain-containing protein [Burkholderiaceae bacterium]